MYVVSKSLSTFFIHHIRCHKPTISVESQDKPFVMSLSFIGLLLNRLARRVTGNMGGRPGGSMNSSFFIGGENAQLTKDKKWSVNTLNKAQQTYKNKVSLSSSLSLCPSVFLPHLLPKPCSLPLAHSLSRPLPFTKGRLRAYKVPINTECLPLAPPTLNCWQLWCLG